MLDDVATDYAIQDYQAAGSEAQAEVKQLLAYTAAHNLPPVEEASILLTAFLGLQIGYRNQPLFHYVVERTYELLPQLLSEKDSLSNMANSKLTAHLLILLYAETLDDTLQPDIDHLMAIWADTSPTEEDRYALQLYNRVYAA